MKKLSIRNMKLGSVLSAVIGVILTVFLSAVFVLLAPIFIINEYWQQGIENYIIPIYQLLTVFISSYIAGILTDQKKAASAISVGCIYLLIIISASVLVFDSVTGWIIAISIACLVGMIMAVLCILKPQKSLVGKKRSTRYR